MTQTGELIRTYRKQRNLTQAELAKKCGTSAAMIRQYELGKRNPKIETLVKISDALDVSYKMLVTNNLIFDAVPANCKINDILKKADNGESLTSEESALLRSHINFGMKRASEVFGEVADKLQEMYLLAPYNQLTAENKQKVISYTKGLLDIQTAEEEITKP